MVRSLTLLSVSVFPPVLGAASPPLPVFFVRGDTNSDAQLDLSDPIASLNYLFLGDAAPSCLQAADSNGDAALDLSDPIYFLTAHFLGGPAIPPPSPECGNAPAGEGLLCSSYPPCEFEALVSAYSVLRTVAGRGLVSGDGINGWRPEFEEGEAIFAELSTPHNAMADAAGNTFIADKDAHAIRKVTPDGKIFTVAGTNTAGNGGDEAGPGISRALDSPNGLWVGGDSTVYILDLGNEKVRRLSPQGELSTIFRARIRTGRGLWVSEDERLVYFTSRTELKRWSPEDGSVTVTDGFFPFVSLGNIAIEPSGSLLVTDRDDHRVYRVTGAGTVTPIAGNGLQMGNGDGRPALETALAGVRAVWRLENGGYILGTHDGCQVWHVDSRGIARVFLDGSPGSHSGDGEHFRTPGKKVAQVRGLTIDAAGNIIITEHDAGFIRMIERRR